MWTGADVLDSYIHSQVTWATWAMRAKKGLDPSLSNSACHQKFLVCSARAQPVLSLRGEELMELREH